MVSFSCEQCQDTVKKPKVQQHAGRCRGAQFTCVDCSVTFDEWSVRSHTSCMTEDQKYQGKLWKGNQKPAKGNKKQQAGGKAPGAPASSSAQLMAPPGGFGGGVSGGLLASLGATTGSIADALAASADAVRHEKAERAERDAQTTDGDAVPATSTPAAASPSTDDLAVTSSKRKSEEIDATPESSSRKSKKDKKDKKSAQANKSEKNAKPAVASEPSSPTETAAPAKWSKKRLVSETDTKANVQACLAYVAEKEGSAVAVGALRKAFVKAYVKHPAVTVDADGAASLFDDHVHIRSDAGKMELYVA